MLYVSLPSPPSTIMGAAVVPETSVVSLPANASTRTRPPSGTPKAPRNWSFQVTSTRLGSSESGPMTKWSALGVPRTTRSPPSTLTVATSGDWASFWTEPMSVAPAEFVRGLKPRWSVARPSGLSPVPMAGLPDDKV